MNARTYDVRPGDEGGKRGEANARLIAAAPDLLAFAQDFLKFWAGPGTTDSPLEAQCRAAIARATGAA